MVKISQQYFTGTTRTKKKAHHYFFFYLKPKCLVSASPVREAARQRLLIGKIKRQTN